MNRTFLHALAFVSLAASALAAPVTYRPECDRLVTTRPLYRPGVDRLVIFNPVYRPETDRIEIRNLCRETEPSHDPDTLTLPNHTTSNLDERKYAEQSAPVDREPADEPRAVQPAPETADQVSDQRARGD